MNSFAKKITILFLAFAMMLGMTGCSTHKFASDETLLITAEELQDYVGAEHVVIVDMQSEENYLLGHVTGAVNIPVSELMINVPVDNMLTSKSKIEALLGSKGIDNETLIIAYDDNKMSASRFLWSLFMYGYENVKVVDGGLSSIKEEKIELVKDVPAITETTFTTAEPSSDWLATKADVMEQVNNPDKNVILLDVRSDEEYQKEGKIPTSIMMDYTGNYFNDGTFKTKQITRINYLEEEIYPESEIIVYCRTSMRAAPVFVQLYEAGYRNIKIYDGAFLEWSSNSSNPIDIPDGAVIPSSQDAS